jgi:hypothetical protein
MELRRFAPLALLVPAAAVGATLTPLVFRAPKTQVIRYELGDSAADVEEVTARWAERSAGDDWLREATFRYRRGQAPRVVTSEPRLADGDYTVEIETLSGDRRATVRRHVALAGGVTSIDVRGGAR